ncbi:MAG: phosphodiester glycosidase family protein [bacterium]
MKNTVCIKRYLVLVFSFCLAVLSFGIHQEVSFPITDGISYHHIQSDTDTPLRNISILTIDLNNPNLSVTVATAYNGLERVSSIVHRNQAVAGINGGFFSFSPKVPVGLVITNGKLVCPPLSDKPARAAIGITSTHKTVFDRVGYQDGKLMSINSTDWSEVTEALGGVSMLVRNGQPYVSVLDDAGGKSFRITTHPRTAVGVTKDNKLIWVIVDGRQPNLSNGISLDDLANLMIKLGAVDAMNLDGGGSSTLVIYDTIVNFPSDKDKEGNFGQERAVANGFIVKSNPK